MRTAALTIYQTPDTALSTLQNLYDAEHRDLGESLFALLPEADHTIVAKLVQSYAVHPKAPTYHALSSILRILHRHAPVFRSSGLAETIAGNITNLNGVSGLLHELNLFDVSERSLHRQKPTRLRSSSLGQEIDVRSFLVDGLDVFFEAKQSGKRNLNNKQFRRLALAALNASALLVYVSQVESHIPDGCVPISVLAGLLNDPNHSALHQTLHNAHAANIEALKRQQLEMQKNKPASTNRESVIYYYKVARQSLTNQQNRDYMPILDQRLRLLSNDERRNIWHWIAKSPETSDIKFEMIYNLEIISEIIADESRTLLDELLSINPTTASL